MKKNSDFKQFNDYKKKFPNASFIAKPQSGAKGENIMLFRELHDLPVVDFRSKDYVVQRYIESPLLLDGLKFDVRIFVCMFGLDPIHAFIADEGLARFCTVSSI